MTGDERGPGDGPAKRPGLAHRRALALPNLFEELPVPTLITDQVARTFATNRAFRELFGFEDEPITFDVLLGATDAAFASTVEDHRSAIEAGGTVDVDKRYRRADGSSFWGHLTVKPLLDEEGALTSIIATVVDVTAHVEAQRAVAESEERFRALVQNATDAIIVLDELGRLVYATPSAERLTGNRIEDVAGADIFQYVHPDDRAVVELSFASIFDEAVADEPNIPLRFRVVHNDGSIRFVEAISTNLLDDPAVNGIVVNIRDLTDSAVAQSALELSEHRFRRMIENISDTVSLLDRSGRIVQSTGHFDPGPLGPTGRSWVGLSAYDLVHPDDREIAMEGFSWIMERPGADLSGESRLLVDDGSYIDAEVFAVNLLDDPDVAAVVVTARDISERKRAEREVNEARDQAVQALQMRTEFIASVSHELRSPIHGVLGLSELLASADLDEDSRQLAQSIGRATETLRMVLDDILDYSKIEVGRLEIDLGPLVVAEVADDLVALFGPEARAKGIDLVVEAERGFPVRVKADALRVRQVLTNLVGNAVKFTTAGEVRVRASTEPPDGSGETRVRIEVRDTGIGIPEEAHDRLFLPFSQAHTSTAREFGGTGLGLSIAKRLVELMGGTLGFESVPTQGSSFWFVLPVEVLPAPEEDDAESIDVGVERAAHSTRVMVVEDNPVNQLLVRRQLERLGFDAVVFDTGAAAVEDFLTTDAHVVLMDWQLPGIDGLETTRRLRELERSSGRDPIPIVAMTASAMPGDRERCLAAGMDDFIAKPVSMATLGDIIRQWVVAPPRPPASSTALPPLSGGGRGLDLRVWDTLETGGAAAGADAGPDEELGADPGGAPGNGAIALEVLDHLVEDLADPQLVASVVRTYLRELGPRLDAIEQALGDGDDEGRVAAAHLLRSTSVAVGALRLATRCEVLERDRPGPELGGVAEALHAEADEVRADLAVQLERLAPTG